MLRKRRVKSSRNKNDGDGLNCLVTCETDDGEETAAES
jgi:hypothetical protein